MKYSIYITPIDSVDFQRVIDRRLESGGAVHTKLDLGENADLAHVR